ncbi:non-ribosomal peptide synthase domain TIGR01720/amino acid adenylation domain-containing protein [Ectopseudomonas composti]|uniref:Non-ribosomal peptide synthase domain TIGR01720/amino acid adenylation domain-containing protein n=1 Tax=Ectopseudomonas composti TaxID=658457 RepID=A0A1I5KCR5_9GAMM|nr:non-ribosomal peptide synthetase [Pseudomonas composti]SFO82533.1 non-ribosomal peptide synthase domain TIGR01720/amino acid adenylation domain-containing protein [Pseudomonas composti]
MTMLDAQLRTVAERLAALPEEKQLTFLQQLREKGVSLERLPITRQPCERAPLSPAQSRLWFLWQMEPHSAAYNIPAALRLRGTLDTEALRQAFEALVARHETLRTLFREEGGEPLQVILPTLPLAMLEEDLSSLPSDRREDAAHERLEQLARQSFDLANGPLLRLHLLRLSDSEHLLLLNLHHIVSDGWSMGVLIDEFASLYGACVTGHEASLPPLPIQYADHGRWQWLWMAAGEEQRQLDYWTQRIGDPSLLLSLPSDRPRPPEQSYRGATLDFQLPTAWVSELRSLARGQGASLFMVLLAAFEVLLVRYSGQRELRIGVPVANRGRAECERLVGFFVNTQVLCGEVEEQASFVELLGAVRQAVLEAQAHQELPFERLVEALQPERSLSHNPLFQVACNHLPSAQDALGELPAADGGALTMESLQLATGIAKFDLMLQTEENREGAVRGQFAYASDLFEAATIERLCGHFLNLLKALATDPQCPVGRLPMLAGAEREQLLDGWNATEAAFPADVQLQTLLQQQAAKTPDALALQFGAQRLSYRELHQRANQLARWLRAQCVGPDVLVGVAAERSIELVVALLAIVKAGGAYVPMDPDYPHDRLQHMLDDSGVTLLLTQAHLRDALPASNARTFCLDSDWPEVEGLEGSDLPVQGTPDNLAYLIYTSGSTGKPKGAGNSHQALINRLHWMQKEYALTPADRVLQKTPFSFDVSVWEFFWPLLTGAALVVAEPGAHRDPLALRQVINQGDVSVLHFVPSMLQAFVASGELEHCPSLKQVMCSGEALPYELQQQFRQRHAAKLHNLYGPTEAAIDVSYWACYEENERHIVPIGRPIDNLRLYILDTWLEPVPQGVAGELYIGGVGLARGYHARPGLTAERFVADPFGEGGRLYRTGDLARWRADGAIEYVGRIDHQVKIRGLRIELGEIEARLQAHPQVEEAVVVARDTPQGKQLVGYAVAGCDSEVLRQALAEQLPEFMVPARILVLDAMPLSPNGKLDRKALPEPDFSVVQADYQAPETAHERLLAEIWQSVLGVAQVGREDNFFELGGDSIVSIQVVSRARQAGLQLTPKDMFQHQSLRALAAVVREAVSEPEQGPEQGETPLLPIQRLFFATPMPQRAHWNQAVLLHCRETLDAQRMAKTLAALQAHHDALRLRFAADGSHAVHAEQVAADVLWLREAADVSELEGHCAAAQRSLDLEHGPLLRAMLVNMADGSQRLLLVVHHLVIDGVSWRALLEDLQAHYDGQPLPPRSSSFKRWAQRLVDLAASPELGAEQDYWRAQLEAQAPSLPGARTDASLAERHARTLRLELDEGETRALLQQAPAAYRTQVNDLLLTALARALCAWSGQGSAAVLLEGHGRETLFDDIDLSRTLGWFTSLYPLRLQADGEPGAAIKEVKEQLRAVPRGGLGYGLLRHLGQGLDGLHEPRVTFNYLGQFDASFASDALLRLASESAGANRDGAAPLGNWLSIDGQVLDARLGLRFTFSSEMFDEAPVMQLAQRYLTELRALITHCLTPGAGGVTPADFPLAGLDQAQLDTLDLLAAAIEDIYPLSPMQQGMLFHALDNPGSGLYVNQISVAVEALDPARLQAAWAQVVARHETLRSGFLWQGGLRQPLQVVQRQVPTEVRVIEGETDVIAFAERDRAEGFDLARPPLQRMSLLALGEGRWQLVWTMHHLVTDGWSGAQLIKEVLQVYAGECLPAPVARYADYIAWLQHQDGDAAEAFWRQRLTGLDEPCLLADSLSRPAEGSGHGVTYSHYDAGATERLRAFARQQRVTLNTLLQGAWLLLLQRYTGKQRVTFGATVAGRPTSLAGAETLLGLFINTLPVVQAPAADAGLGDWLRALQAYNLEVREYEHTPLYDIQRWAGHGGQALFDSIIVFENYPVDEALRRGGGDGPRFGELASKDVTSVPMDLAVRLGEGMEIEYQYLRSHFHVDAVLRIRANFEQILAAMLQGGEQRLGDIDCLSTLEHEAHHRLHGQASLPTAFEPVHLAVTRHNRERPQDCVLIDETVSLDRQRLELDSNRLAQRLTAFGVGPEVRVGVALPRGVELPLALLAVLKAGGAYVPLDADYPRERLAFQMQDAGITLLLTDSRLRERLPVPDGVVCLELDRLDLSAEPCELPQVTVHPGNLAYLIYTSGSTGQPKGVAVAHGQIAAHCRAIGERYAMTAQDRELIFMSFAFDGAHERWLTTLSHGGSLLIRGEALWSAEQTLTQLREHRVTVAAFPPAYLLQLADQAAQLGHVPSMRIYCFGGDAVPEAAFELARRTLKAEYLINGYGPTETVVTPLLWKADASTRCQAAYAPIGQAVGARRLYILDPQLRPVPLGVAGELYIGGDLLARGYHQRPGLTAERFVADPFGEPSSRLYRSGDLVRGRADGVVEYVGRIDHQVKIRGFRIELGEIEARLQAHAQVREAVVVAREGGSGKQLIGYVVGEVEGDALRSYLRAQLPDYMVPAQILRLERMPLSPAGKIDRKALPEPSWQGAGYVAPRNDAERILAEIWAQVLQVEQVGIHDNFFDLGGDSILSLQVVSRARQAEGLGLELRLRDLLQYQSIAALLERPQQVSEPTQTLVTDMAEDEEHFALLPIQQWLFDQHLPEPDHFNQALLLACHRPLDARLLEQALRLLLAEHGSLRLAFARGEGGQWRQRYCQLDELGLEADPLLWHRQPDDAAEALTLANRAQRSLDIGQGRLLRAVYSELADGSRRLLLVIQHLGVDGVSWRVLLEDLQRLYVALQRGEVPSLPPASCSYRQWAHSLTAYASQPSLREELPYWLQQTASEGLGEPPRDNPRGRAQVALREQISLRLDRAATTRLLKVAPQAYRTQINDLLLAALGRALCGWSEQRAVLVGLEGHGREDLFDGLDHSRTLGWFTSLFPVRLEAGEGDYSQAITALRQRLRTVPNKGIGYGVLRYLADGETRSRLAARAQPRVTFNYLGQLDQNGDGDALFSLLDERPGDAYAASAPLNNWLEIVGQVHDGELALRCLFSRRVFRPTSIERFMALYEAELLAVIDHCCAQTAQEAFAL